MQLSLSSEPKEVFHELAANVSTHAATMGICQYIAFLKANKNIPGFLLELKKIKDALDKS